MTRRVVPRNPEESAVALSARERRLVAALADAVIQRLREDETVAARRTGNRSRDSRFQSAVSRVSANTDPSLWPVSLRIAEVAILTRQSQKGLYGRVVRGTAQPMPVTNGGLLTKPYRWHRDTVRRFVEGSLNSGSRDRRRSTT